MCAHRWKLLFTAAVFAGAMAFIGTSPPVSAGEVPKDLLELDGNTVDDNLFVRGDSKGSFDWDNANGQAVVVEFFNMTDNVGGVDANAGLQMTQGTKDDLDISTWVFKEASNTTPKDDLAEIWGAAVTDPDSGDLILYFAAERAVASGTTTFGFWLFVEQVEIELTPLNGDSFSDDMHRVGDVLIVVDVGGNTIEGVRVFEWAGADGPAGFLDEIGMVGDANCDTVAQDADSFNVNICGAVSSDGLFIEIGLDFDDLLGSRCIASAMSTTRTSNRPRASVKNFKLVPDFQLCGIDVTKACEVIEVLDIDPPLFKVNFSGFVENTGQVAFDSSSSIDLTDDAGTSGNMADDVMVNATIADLEGVCLNGSGVIVVDPITLCTMDSTCTAIDSQWSCSGDGGDGIDPGEILLVAAQGETVTGMFESDNNGPNNGITGTLTDTVQNFTAPSDDFFVTCGPISISPMLFAEKSCTTTLKVTGNQEVSVQLDFDGTFCNTGDIPLIIDVDDTITNTNLWTGKRLEDGVACFDNAPCDGGTCLGEEAGECGLSATSCFDDATCDAINTGDTCSNPAPENGVCVDSTTGLFDPDAGMCDGGANAGNDCSSDEDCPDSFCDGARQVCEVFAGSFLPSQAGAPNAMAGFCVGGTDDSMACAVAADCSGGMCLVDPASASANFFNEVEVRASVGDNPLLTSIGDQVEMPSTSCDLCPQD